MKIERFVFMFLTFLFTFHMTAEAKMNNNFKIELRLVSAKEVKDLIPSADIQSGEIEINGQISKLPNSDSNYLFGWVSLSDSGSDNYADKRLPSCKVLAWNKFFRQAFTVSGLSTQKSYFLIPLGSISIPDRKIEYQIS